jgi:hypothetical protein
MRVNFIVRVSYKRKVRVSVRVGVRVRKIPANFSVRGSSTTSILSE